MAATALRPHSQKIRVPSQGDRIYKEECVYCFDNPESPTGLYVCLNTFLGLSRKHVMHHYNRTGNAVYLHIKRIKTEIIKDPETVQKPTKLAIGLEGGFDVGSKKYDIDEKYTVVILPECYEIPLPCPDLPEMVQLCVTTILASDSASKVEEALAMDGTWDGTKLEVSKHAEGLLQIDNGIKIPPKGWKCEVCGMTENLWLNLTDGAIHCGRQFFDGSGGKNHAVEHYNETKFPLVVKLGTITADGADVFSYDENNSVLDPNLPAHLSHFGINISELKKTDKSMNELEIELNQRVGEWSIIQESGSSLVPMYGPGYTGLENLGNSCYLNSIMQVLFTIPDFQRKYFTIVGDVFAESSTNPTQNFNIQMVKLAHGLLSGVYSKAPEDISKKNLEQPGIRPLMFKSLIGQGHPEFSTKRQQDAQEFFLHVITLIERYSRDQANPADALKFQVEEKIQCVQSGKVKYNNRADFLLSLPIPLEAATNKEEVLQYEKRRADNGDRIKDEEIVRPRISLEACIESFASPEEVQDFFSTALNAKSAAYKTFRIFTFPDYLMIHLKKFTLGDDWVPKKLDVAMDVPDTLNLQSLRGKGKLPNEQELPEASVPKVEFQFNEDLISELTDMGFPREACKRSLYYTGNNDISTATIWLTEHIDDADYSSPFNPCDSSQTSDLVPDENCVTTIINMGFTAPQAHKALKATNNNLERAVDWIFSHLEEVETPMDCSEPAAASENVPKFRDGPEQYELVAFVSHMGTSTVCGHYVCHIKKDGRWVIFNDNKVGLSEHPPKEFAYMYLYKRILPT